MPPEGVELDDGGAYLPSDPQRWLWDKWDGDDGLWTQVARLRDRLKVKSWHLALNGDLVDGDHHNTSQIVSRHPDAQMDIAKACLMVPLVQGPSSVVVTRGTEVHVGKSGSAENSLARWMAHQGHKVIGDDVTGQPSHWEFEGIYAGARVNLAHHGKMGQKPWTRGNATLSSAAEMIIDRAVSGDPIPHLALRSHYHRWAESGTNFPVRFVQLPAYQLATAFVHRIAAGSLADIGGAAFHLEDGEVRGMYPIKYLPKRPGAIRVS
jgi:hypothetical protein